ncbi:MAG: tetratricopeptide repeat protein [Verrucomicrobiia bacterium]
MSNRRKRSTGSANFPKAPTQDQAAFPARSLASGWRLWVFRLLALVVVPALFLGLVELSLRLAGFGYPTAFLLPATLNGQKVFVQNNRFGWRFLGPKLSRLPWPISIPQTKAPDTVRIFVFGESAAQGDPQYVCGLPRMLQAMLALRHPGVHFEVVNAAMTAINSYAILPIARDCAKADGDLWVIYMGNNEVVGPFGPGTVFGPQVPPLPLIRGILALKTTRTGQLLDFARQWIRKPPAGSDEWGGMKMFLDQQVQADDPRMNAVYDHFERNLADILRAGQRRGVGMVVSTVAVNLKDCAPFASAHRPGLSGADQAKWEALYQSGVQAQAAGKEQEAADRFQAAAQIDDRFAALRFRQGECALALGQTQPAQWQFQAARDLDTLRFRCDSKLNDLIRQVAAQLKGERILLADAERAFAEQSPDGLPGENLFYEHVHLNFNGNYLLARTIGAEIEKLLPGWVAARGVTNRPWPSAADCARRLGWSDLDELSSLNIILARSSAAPFTGQLNHDAQMLRLQASIERLAPAMQPAGLKETERIREAAVAANPDDPALYGLLAAVQSQVGDLTDAAGSLRHELALLPDDSLHWFQLGIILTQEHQFEEAAADFQRALQLDPTDVESVNNLAQSLWMLGRREEAIREFRRMTAMSPESSLAWINLGQILEETGRKAAAEDCYHKALAIHSNREPDLLALARFCRSRGWLEAAVTNYNAAIELKPGDANLRAEAGQSLLILRHYAEAAQQLAEAVRLNPKSAKAHLLYGLAVGQENMTVAAEAQFREALRLQPDLLEARINLGVALMKEKYLFEALSQFEEVLQQSPTNSLALEYAQALRARLARQPAR